MAASFYWRLGQLAEGTRSLADAATWYERAADQFHREQALGDEAVARMALARTMFHLRGAGDARQPAREAVLAAREAGEEARTALLGEALELAAEVALDLGQGDDAVASYREALRHHERVRIAAGGEARSSDEVRAAVALAEALLDQGHVVAAASTYEAVEPLVESHDSLETRGRGAALKALLALELGKLEEAAEPLRQAHEWLDVAGATMRRARLFVATARRIERRVGHEQALPHYEKGWALAQAARDEHRLAPIGYALARGYLMKGDPVKADATVIEVLAHLRNIGDLEGLAHTTELAVRIALKLAQGSLALERLILLARTRGRMGDKVGAVRTLRSALEAALVVPEIDVAPVAAEFMEALRQTGGGVLGPGEAMAIAESFAKGDHPLLAAEIATLEAERHVAEGRRSEGARTFAKAAVWLIQAGQRWASVDLWDRALDIAHAAGLPEKESWLVERTLAAEG